MNLDLIPPTALFLFHSFHSFGGFLYILSHSTLGVWGTILYHYSTTSLFYLYLPTHTLDLNDYDLICVGWSHCQAARWMRGLFVCVLPFYSFFVHSYFRPGSMKLDS